MNIILNTDVQNTARADERMNGRAAERCAAFVDTCLPVSLYIQLCHSFDNFCFVLQKVLLSS